MKISLFKNNLFIYFSPSVRGVVIKKKSYPEKPSDEIIKLGIKLLVISSLAIGLIFYSLQNHYYYSILALSLLIALNISIFIYILKNWR